MTAQTANIAPTTPETLPQFLKLLTKGMLKKLPVKLLLAGGIALFSWILHTYLLVVTNEGFNSGNSFWLDRILALQGRTITGALVWTLAAGLITSTIARIMAYGFKDTVRGITDTPRYIWDWANELSLLAIPFIFVGYFLTVILGFFINNSLLVAQLWLVVAGILIARETSITVNVLRLGWSDAQRMAKREKIAPFKLAWVGMYFTGVLIGLISILPSGNILAYVCGCLGFLTVIVISVGIFVRSQGGTERLIGKKLLLWIVPPALLLLLKAAAPAFADDGGWQESGGTFSGWINSAGAFRAVVMGILPAGGAGAGVLVGTALGSMVSIIGSAGVPSAVSSIKPSAPTPTKTTTTPPPSRTADHQVEGFQQQEQMGADPSRSGSGQLEKSADEPTGGPLESRTADHQTEGLQQTKGLQQDKPDPNALSSRHRAGDSADAPAADGGSLRSERASHEGDFGRTGQGATEAGTGQRDVRGVQPTQSGSADPGSGSAAGSADQASKLGQDSPAGQMSDRHRPNVPDRTEGQLSDRHQQGGLSEQGADSARLGGRERPIGMADQGASGGPRADRHDPGGMTDAGTDVKPAGIEQPGPGAERHTPDAPSGPRAERHDPGGMAEGSVDAKPAGIEQPGPTAERHTPAAQGGPSASRHDPDVVAGKDAGTLQARHAPTESAGPTAERYTAGETVEPTGPLHSRQPAAPEPELPLPPVPVPGYALDWQLMVVRTPEGSGVTVQQRIDLKERTRIGRHGAIDLKLLDPKVSRQHADIEIEGSTCRIADLDSSNGTFVNGRRLTEPAELKHGDAIKIGDTYFVVQHRVN